MIEISKSHDSSIRLSMLFVMLGMCVFFWGLAYKLSLYDVHQPSVHRIPVAKLMSRDEDPNTTDSVRLCLAKPTPPQLSSAYAFVIFVLSIGSIAGPKITWDRRHFQLSKPWCLRLLATLSAFSFRPPPVLSGF